ncbi:MAG: transglycosylase domain-containing protein, partial [Acidimicrobiales bacterium]
MGAAVARILAKLLGAILAGAAGTMAALLAVAPAARTLLTAGTAGGRGDVLAFAELPQTSTVYAADGSVLTTLHADQDRVPVTIDHVPAIVVAAVVDTEDAKFWIHHGIDIGALLRAFLTDSRSGQLRQGGSTITEQLVKNSILTNQRNVGRKLKEAALAVRLEDDLTKRQIMERYLNTIYFGNGAYGIGAAAETYFGVTVDQLTPAQGALLAGLIRNPDGYDPFRHPTEARLRRNHVLDRMVVNHDLTPEAAASLKETPLPPRKTQLVPAPDGQDGYFIEEVKQRLLRDPALGTTPQARYNTLFRGGLRIYTTLQPALQTAAEVSVARNLPDNHGQWTAALVSVDATTGAVRALVGGPGFDRSQYRIATEGPGRQPGSSFKPIVLAAALEQGYNINASVDGSSPCSFPIPRAAPYVANNNEGEAGGETSLANALALSLNCAYARLGVDVGLGNVVSMAKRLGITTPLSPYISLSIGSEEVLPIDMAGVYATFADNGIHHTPFLVAKVVDPNGKVLLTGGDPGTQVLSPQKAHEEIVALRDVVQYGTGTAAALPGREVAGKTGTTDNTTNAWFDGFSPQLATVVWVGSPVANIPMASVGGTTALGVYEYPRRVYGATYPAMIWHDYMAAALAPLPSLPFPAPEPNDMGGIYAVPEPLGSYTAAPRPTTPPPIAP